jgi:P4 family phage/plasmid primase-like protien
MSYNNNYNSLLSSYHVKKGESQEITNTRIGNSSLNIKGGSYHIPADQYKPFLREYATEIFLKGSNEYLTEKQLPSEGPLLIDMDLRHTIDTVSRQYTNYHKIDLINTILAILLKVYLFDKSCEFPIFIYEKDTVNCQQDTQITKDGLHIMIGIQSGGQPARMKIRDELIACVSEMWSDIPITNTWSDVFDEGIFKGHTNWQLFGSRKPGNQPYKLTHAYKIVYDKNEDEFIQKERELESCYFVENIKLLSARYPNHIALPVRSDVVGETAGGGAATTKQSARNTMIHVPNTTSASLYNITIQSVRTHEELSQFMEQFMNTYIPIIDVNNILTDTHSYLNTLPPKYYAPGSYDNWMRTAWALKNTHDSLFPYWVEFSAKSSGFLFYDIPTMYEKWASFDMNNPNGLTLRSIMHWSKIDAPEKYKEVRTKTIDYRIERCVKTNKYEPDLDDKRTAGCTTVDLAELLHYIYKDRFICSSIKGNIWYEFNHHYWREIDSGVVLRNLISTEMRRLFDKKRGALFLAEEAAEEGPKKEALQKEKEKYGSIYTRLGVTCEKNNIMTEARELFYDDKFFEKIDSNNHLICFKNGVYDFKQGVFRKGYPEDYITLCTNINYLAYDRERDEPLREELRVFLSQLFPDPELCRYMTEHLASAFIGGNPNQTMNMYMGHGQNGKSVLTGFMGMVLGDYKGDVPLSLIVTRERTKIGGTAPELLALKGKRYAVMQEPSKGDVINDGIMKQITSGEDVVQARGLYQQNSISFIPGFKLVVCMNEQMTIDGNSHGTWRRVRLVPFDSLFTDNPVKNDPLKPHQFLVDKNMRLKFEEWKEVFAVWMVEIATKTQGMVKDCDAVLAASNAYRESQDKFSQFIAERIMKDPQGRLDKKTVKQEFDLWYAQNIGGKPPIPRDLYEVLDKMFGRNTLAIWNGIKIRYADAVGFETETENIIREDGPMECTGNRW